MDIKQQKAALEKKRSIFIWVFMITFILGTATFGFGFFKEISLLRNIGALFFFTSVVFFVLAYKTGMKYINL